MKVAGIIAECNPLHEGHKYLLSEARVKTGADYIVVAMSGDYVQRGAPSILSLRDRAESLITAGADLVLELPLYVSCAGADYFARGGVALLESLGVVTDLVFGSESGDLDALGTAAGILAAEDDAYRESLRDGLRSGKSFPQARAAAFEASLSESVKSGRSCQPPADSLTVPSIPETPNDLLGAEYLKALRTLGSPIRPHAVPRISCRSASEIRAQMLQSRKETDPFLCRDDLSDLLLHALFRAAGFGGAGPSKDMAAMDCAGHAGNPCGAEELSLYLDVTDDMARRILRELPSFTTYSAFCEKVKTRNFTYTRISRALMHILLGMTSRSMERFDSDHGLCGWIRPIGFKRSAFPLIRAVTSSCKVPFLDKLAAAEKILPSDLYSILCEEIRAEFLYDLMAARRTGMNAGNADGDVSGKGVLSAFRNPIIIA